MAYENELSVEEIMAQIMEKAAAKAQAPAEQRDWSADEIDDLLSDKPLEETAADSASEEGAPMFQEAPEEPKESWASKYHLDEMESAEEEPAAEEPEKAEEPAETVLNEEETESLIKDKDDAVAFVDDVLKRKNKKAYKSQDHVKTAPIEFDLSEEEPTTVMEPITTSDVKQYNNKKIAEAVEEPQEDLPEEEMMFEEEEPRAGFGNRMRGLFGRARSAVTDFIEGGMEEYEEDYDDEDYEEDQPKELDPESINPTEQQTKIFDTVTPEGSQIIDSKQQVHLQGELSKGLDENPESPKMIMELADEGKEVSAYDKRALADKTVGIHPIHNENIQHQIRVDTIEHSGGGMPTDKNRERFLNKPKQRLETTAEYEALHAGEEPEPVERGGFIVKKSKFANTADLEPIPTIIAADAELNTFDKAIVAKDGNPVVEHTDTEIDGQIKLLGFDDEPEVIEQIEEETAEDNLRESRVQKIKEFHLDTGLLEDPKEETQEADAEPEVLAKEPKRPLRISKDAITTDYLDDEYKKSSDKDRIENGLYNAKRASFISAIAQGAIALAAVIMSILTGGSLVDAGGGSTIFVLINIVLLIVAVIFGVRTIAKGLRGFVGKHINAAGATTIVVVVALIEEIILAFVTQSHAVTVGMYTGAAALALAAASLTRYLSLTRALDNFDFITSGVELYASDAIEDEEDSFEIGRGLLIEDPTVNYSAKVQKPKAFVENSFADDPADYEVEKPTLIVAGVALILAIIFGIVHHSFTIALGLFTAILALGIPCFVTLASNIGLFTVDRTFSRKGSAILGHRAVEESADMNAYAIDSCDIFPKEAISIIGIKTFHNMRIDDAILYSAAMAIAGENPLGGVFESTILGKRDLLPPVESVAYEERLGLSAWIHGRRTLLGNRDLLINHNVEITDEEFEQQYTHNGRKVVYLAVAGKIAAMFVVQYRADKRMRLALQNADRAGITLLVRNSDCNITEDMISRYYKIPAASIKILSPVSGELFQKYRNSEKLVATSGLINNGTVEASLRTVYEARRLYDAIFTNSIVAMAYSAIAIVIGIILAAVIEPSYISDFRVVLFQVLFGAVAVGLPWLQSRHVSK